ncbi:hypothetical protein U8Q06_20930 [Rhizobium beringeri]|uniref:hypothetical protein n=1 Tax=Rhizobium beringeri TaxID=3019934 RepID=UPI002E12A786|nr:hypothetical protein U8Q06_20930 [Rhizobium beringeri]
MADVDTTRDVDEAAGMVAQLRDMHGRLRDGRPLTGRQVLLLVDGLGGYLETIDDGGAASLDRSFGLKQWGGVSPARSMALDQRDRMLRRLWREVPEWRPLMPGAAARQMLASFRRYETDRWPRERHLQLAPVVEPAATWWRIASGNAAMPDVPRLRQILKT